MAITLDGTTGINTSGSLTTTGSVISGSTITSTSSLTTGTGAVYDGISRGTAVASTSGTSIDFTSIPSWIKRITVMLSGVSTSGTSNLMIQLGTGSTPTYTATGYAGTISNQAGSTATFSVGFLLTSAIAASDVHAGASTLVNISGNNWIETSSLATTSGAATRYGAGVVTLGAALTAVRVTTVNGIDTFDAGSINILYE